MADGDAARDLEQLLARSISRRAQRVNAPLGCSPSSRASAEGTDNALCACAAKSQIARTGQQRSRSSEPGVPPVPHVAAMPPTSSAERSRWQGEELSAKGLHGACAAGPGSTRLQWRKLGGPSAGGACAAIPQAHATPAAQARWDLGGARLHEQLLPRLGAHQPSARGAAPLAARDHGAGGASGEREREEGEGEMEVRGRRGRAAVEEEEAQEEEGGRRRRTPVAPVAVVASG